MTVDIARIRQCVQSFDLRRLFIQELGWDKPAAGVTVAVDGQTFALQPIAHKRGFQVFQCPPAGDGALPDHPTRAKIERQIAKSAHHHIVIYTDAAKTVQTWQWVRRELGRPLARRESHFRKGDTGEPLAQKLQHLQVSLDEEERITLTDVTRRGRQAFDVDRVTKRFYDRFKTEHTSFLAFVKGIAAVADSEWYASLMLNRLMFIYFIQKKGFLDGDPDYLRNRLRRIQAEKGKDKFHSFYRYFLLRLFHEGLGQPAAQRGKELAAMLGEVPYLNGGLFDVHELERAYPEIQIADDAFTRLFDFFDAYQWHLDERPLRSDNEINPDVLGYIFEKYINQKQMGAYYTKEDITGYIARNTLIPFLFNAAEKKCAIAFKPDSALWRLLRDDPDRYIYEAVRKGADVPLPPDIAAGIGDVSKRGGWNKPAGPDFALPTETWREHVARRQRCHDLRAKLRAGEIHDINDLITYNLDITQFAEDAIDNCEGPELLRAFYHAIEDVSVLDPTCGSGAFLFAALNLLEPLYEACLDRMHGFLDDLAQSGAPHHPEKFSDFAKILKDVDRHPNHRYFILKSIIVGNLYGVDIMEEAVEICKLRLFLKLVAQVETARQIEPLPDIDFNIRAGNTLIGFASLDEVKKRMEGTLGFQRNEVDRVVEEAEIVDRAFKRFRAMQTDYGMDAGDFSEAKIDLRDRLAKLRGELDRYLAGEYGVDPDKPKEFQKWRGSHQPFHWLAEFYGIMAGGGFDVIIGNPPYISASKVRASYVIHGYATNRCTDIYANVQERCFTMLSQDGRCGMIVPLSLTFSGDFQALRDLLCKGYTYNWFSAFARIPAALFSADVRVRNTIHLGSRKSSDGTKRHFTTVLHRWFEAYRPFLMPSVAYVSFSPSSFRGLVPKINTQRLSNAMGALLATSKQTVNDAISAKPTTHVLHYKKTAYNWLNFCKTLPPCFDSKGMAIQHTKFGQLWVSNVEAQNVLFAFLNGKIMFAYWCMIGDDFDVTRWMFADFPLALSALTAPQWKGINALTAELEACMRANTSFKANAGKRVGNYNLAKCREVTQKSDAVFAEALGLADAWDDIELMYTQIVKTDFDEED